MRRLNFNEINSISGGMEFERAIESPFTIFLFGAALVGGPLVAFHGAPKVVEGASFALPIAVSTTLNVASWGYDKISTAVSIPFNVASWGCGKISDGTSWCYHKVVG